MMLWYLLKKDILIIKKYVLIMLAAAVLIPPFMLWRVPEYAGILGFMLSVIFCVLILLQYISLKEYQFPKAASLLCAATFSRKMMVLSQYIFCITVYSRFRHYECSHVLPDVFSHLCIDQYLSSNTV